MAKLLGWNGLATQGCDPALVNAKTDWNGFAWENAALT